MRLTSASVFVLAAALTGAACNGSTPDTSSNAPASAPAAQAPAGIPPPPDVAAAPSNATKTASGIAWIQLKAGTGTIHPLATSQVKINYTGWKTNGEMFDSSIAKGEPLDMPLNRLIPGWVEGVEMMVIGEKRRFWIPGNLAYDDDPRPGVPKGTLVFEIELLDIK